MTQRKATSSKASRAREAEELRPNTGSRSKNKGRIIKADVGGEGRAVEEEAVSDDDDGLGGCRFLHFSFECCC